MGRWNDRRNDRWRAPDDQKYLGMSATRFNLTVLGIGFVALAAFLYFGVGVARDFFAHDSSSSRQVAVLPSPTPEPTPTPPATPAATPTTTPTATAAIGGTGDVDSFDFKRQLFGAPPTLSVSVTDMNSSTGEVTIKGVDTRGPTIPFTFDWGEGSISDGWFPQQHIYSDVTRNYVVKVTAHYSGGETDSAEALVRFVPPTISPTSSPSDVAVTFPGYAVSLASSMPRYAISDSLTYFDDSFFDVVPRWVVEYILTAAASIQKDFVNDDVYLIDGAFRQVVLRDPSAGGMYSLWYTSPVAFGVGDSGFQGRIQYSSFFHEMGHNFSLKTPSDYHYGGKIDGNANAIFSETMAQLFQHATAYEVINNASTYGLSKDVVFDINESAISSMLVGRNAYENYVSGGMNFSSWNDPATQEDETFGTFMTIAYKFFAHAENAGLGYRVPLKRMTEFLQRFNEDWRQRYDQYHDSSAASAFRATLMVTAMSYAFSEDLRTEFRELGFPISDEIYNELYPTPTATPTPTPTP